MRPFAGKQRQTRRPVSWDTGAGGPLSAEADRETSSLPLASRSTSDSPAPVSPETGSGAAGFGHDFGRVPIYPAAAVSRSGAASRLVQRDPIGAAAPDATRADAASDAQPSWSITSSADPLPGEPVPGYEQPRAAYTEKDRDAFARALHARELANYKNTLEFVGDYGAALVDLWATHATEVMAKSADDAGWSAFGKMLAWVVKESLIALSGAGALRLAAGAVKYAAEFAEFVKLATSAATEAATGPIENSQADVEVTRAQINEKTRQVARLLQSQVGVLVRAHGGEVPYAYWLGQVHDLPELSRFRIPPAFERPPTDSVRVSVAQAIVALLNDDSTVAPANKEPALGGIFGYTLVPAENVIRMEVNVLSDGSAVSSRAALKSSETLAKELRGRPVRELANIPLNIKLASGEDPAAVIRAALGGTELSLQQTLRPVPAVIGDIPGLLAPMDPAAAVVEAYPTHGPLEITRDAAGTVQVYGGGLVEHLYLYRQQNPDADLSGIIASFEAQRISQEREDAAQDEISCREDGAQSSEMLSPQALARQLFAYLAPPAWASGEGVVSSDLVGLTRVHATP